MVFEMMTVSPEVTIKIRQKNYLQIKVLILSSSYVFYDFLTIFHYPLKNQRLCRFFQVTLMLLLSGNWLIRMKERKLHSLKYMARWRVRVPGGTSEPVNHAQMERLLS